MEDHNTKKIALLTTAQEKSMEVTIRGRQLPQAISIVLFLGKLFALLKDSNLSSVNRINKFGSHSTKTTHAFII